jgi:hypothetical protein
MSVNCPFIYGTNSKGRVNKVSDLVGVMVRLHGLVPKMSTPSCTLKVTDCYFHKDRTYLTLEASTEDTVVWFKDRFRVVEHPDLEVSILGTLELSVFNDRRLNVVDILPALNQSFPLAGLVGKTLERVFVSPNPALTPKILPNLNNKPKVLL